MDRKPFFCFLLCLLICLNLTACKHSIKRQKEELARKILENARDSLGRIDTSFISDTVFLNRLETRVAKKEKRK